MNIIIIITIPTPCFMPDHFILGFIVVWSYFWRATHLPALVVVTWPSV